MWPWSHHRHRQSEERWKDWKVPSFSAESAKIIRCFECLWNSWLSSNISCRYRGRCVIIYIFNIVMGTDQSTRAPKHKCVSCWRLIDHGSRMKLRTTRASNFEIVMQHAFGVGWNYRPFCIWHSWDSKMINTARLLSTLSMKSQPLLYQLWSRDGGGN